MKPPKKKVNPKLAQLEAFLDKVPASLLGAAISRKPTALCPYCDEPCGSKRMRSHIRENHPEHAPPIIRRGRKKKLIVCSFCGEAHGAREMRTHLAHVHPDRPKKIGRPKGSKNKPKKTARSKKPKIRPWVDTYQKPAE